MSADRYSACPRCTLRLEKDIAKSQDKLDAAYGVVPLDEFDRMRAGVDAKRVILADTDSNSRRTVREDYEFYGLSEGSVTASYSGHCSVCDLTVKFEFTHNIEDVSS